MARDPDIEILPPDPAWQPPHAPPPVVYDTGPADVPPRHGVREAGRPGDPGVVLRLATLGGRLVAVALVAVLAVWLLEPFGPKPLTQLSDWLRNAGPLGRALVTGGIALCIPLLLPAGPVAILPGYLWGATQGTTVALVGATLGGLLNYEIGRRLLAHHVQAWAERTPLMRSLIDTIDARGFRIVLGMRLSPVMPFGLLSYLSGVTALKPWRFVLAIAIGGIPWTTVYAMGGAILAESSREVSLSGVADQPHVALLRWVGLGLTVVIAAWVGRVARQDLLRSRATPP
jgi:uncharacterized membrane protein YdjX (TVP38/TMEM64 family)